MPADGRFAGGRGDVDDRAGAALAHPGQHGLGRADGAHQVELPRALPDLLGQLLEAVDLGPADVVDEAVDAAEAPRARPRPARSGSPGLREVGGDVQVADPVGAAARGDDLRALGLELARGVEADARRSSR